LRDSILTLKSRDDEAKPLFRCKRKSFGDEDAPSMSKRVKNNEDEVNMEEFPFYGEEEWPLVRLSCLSILAKANLTGQMKDDSRGEYSRLRGSLFPSNISKQRERQIPTWMKPAQAINDARSQLQGDDLELFERLIARPQSVVESSDMIQSWRDGELKPMSWREIAEEKWHF
jgi:hypothetical protein